MVKILIFGCTGLVGKVLIDLIKARNFNYTHVTLVASAKSKGKKIKVKNVEYEVISTCLLYTSPSPRDKRQSRMPSSA